MNGKKDGLQKYRVRINYIDAAGTARQIDRVAYGRDAARELERELQKESTSLQSSRISVKDLYDEYMITGANELRPTTFRTRKARLEHHVLPLLGNYKLNKLTPAALQSWKNEIDKKGLALSMRQSIYAVLRSMLNYAVKLEYIPKNPLLTIGNFKDPYETTHNVDFYTPEEFKKFILAARICAETKDTLAEWGFYVFFNIAFYTGLRKGEIHALKWTDIDGQILHVRRSISQTLKGEDVETPPKNRSSVRDLQLPLPLIDILKDHYMRYKAIPRFNDDWRICGGLKPLRDSTIQKRQKQYAQTAGVKSIRIHDFRHSHASVLANNGINIQEIARRLGHSDIETTWNIYAHLYPREEERAVNVLNKIV